ncbi:MAG: hypothetical protein DRI23_09875 [Candidatus Cloacimonadota bacterium]|nr:MAG: hypothetical protein DRI23_09875 [Candidatus Cloacimonadota bacterium]
MDSLTKYATFGLQPEITFLVDLPAEVGLSRIKQQDADRLEQESLDFHRNVRKGFLEIAKAEKDRYIILDGSKSIDEIHEDIIKNINKFITKN